MRLAWNFSKLCFPYRSITKNMFLLLILREDRFTKFKKNQWKRLIGSRFCRSVYQIYKLQTTNREFNSITVLSLISLDTSRWLMRIIRKLAESKERSENTLDSPKWLKFPLMQSLNRITKSRVKHVAKCAKWTKRDSLTCAVT